MATTYNKELTQEYLKSIINYDEISGIFTWKVQKGKRVKIGDIAGCLDKNKKYLKFNIDRKSYLTHRLAWLYVYGEFPKNMIDHINGIKSDNRIENLREATRAENNWNTPKRKTNTTGYKCVYEESGKFVARCSINGTKFYLGRFDLAEDASNSFIEFSKIHHKDFFYESIRESK